MIIRRSHERGRSYEDWLRSHHSFSFNHYYDPRHNGYGPLLVLNEDVVMPGGGFAAHDHKNVEIITYVLDGELAHEDSAGNTSVIRQGELQLMSAGTGIVHSEFNNSKEHSVHFLQIWVTPDRRGNAPSYQQKAFPLTERRGRLALLVSREGAENSLTIHRDMKLLSGLFGADERQSYTLAAGQRAWVQVARGTILVNGIHLGQGDAVAAGDERLLEIEGLNDAEILLFDLPLVGQ